MFLFREAVLHSYPKERERTEDVPASRQDGNSVAAGLNRRQSAGSRQSVFLYGSLKPFLFCRRKRETVSRTVPFAGERKELVSGTVPLRVEKAKKRGQPPG